MTEFEHTSIGMPPIYGLFDDDKNPLVSVAQAILTLKFDLTLFMETAEEFVDADSVGKLINSIPNFTREDALAIHMYTQESPLYPALNTALRSKDRKLLRECYFPYLRRLLHALEILKRHQNNDGPKETVVIRGVPHDLCSQHPETYVKGHVLSLRTFRLTQSFRWYCDVLGSD